MNYSVNNNHPIMNSSPEEQDDDVSFDDKVLNYLKEQHPDVDLNTLLNQLKALSPSKSLTMQDLVKAMTYADGVLRQDKDEKAYTDNILDKRTSQLIGVNMFFHTSLQSIIYPPDEKEDW